MDGRENAAARCCDGLARENCSLLYGGDRRAAWPPVMRGENSCMVKRPVAVMDGKERAAAVMLGENSCMATRPAGGGDGRTGKSSGGDAAW